MSVYLGEKKKSYREEGSDSGSGAGEDSDNNNNADAGVRDNNGYEEGVMDVGSSSSSEEGEGERGDDVIEDSEDDGHTQVGG